MLSFLSTIYIPLEYFLLRWALICIFYQFGHKAPCALHWDPMAFRYLRFIFPLVERNWHHWESYALTGYDTIKEPHLQMCVDQEPATNALLLHRQTCGQSGCCWSSARSFWTRSCWRMLWLGCWRWVGQALSRYFPECPSSWRSHQTSGSSPGTLFAWKSKGLKMKQNMGKLMSC